MVGERRGRRKELCSTACDPPVLPPPSTNSYHISATTSQYATLISGHGNTSIKWQLTFMGCTYIPEAETQMATTTLPPPPLHPFENLWGKDFNISQRTSPLSENYKC
ncbi:hypothetical protein Adt_38662 [Abeliophyllum distichum]|uniref:Uncharacterized protein n=1 Tax=Abeliophyllum distichum TaxID=126358 RepID=A0ABD1Q2W7_9LAMI